MKIVKIFNIEKVIILFILFLFYLPIKARSQPANIPCYKQSYYINSSIFNGDKRGSKQVLPVFRDIVQIQNASWLRLIFGECRLGQGSYIKITALEDGSQQHLNTNSLKQWKNSSAFFNGNAVQVELFLSENDQGVYFEMNDVIFGESGDITNMLSKTTGDPCTECGICGSIDDRIESNDFAVGRTIRINASGDTLGNCTAWIASNGAYLSAGHCFPNLNSYVWLIQFNVPQSDDDGTFNHPPPEDQYVVAETTDSLEIRNNGVGRDWAVFYCYTNSETGLLPVEAQNAYYRLTIDSNPATFRITGFGLDECLPGSTGGRNSNSLTQQTSTGPKNGEYGSGTSVYWRFSVDIRIGNSGSPIIPLDTGLSVGIQTHCPSLNYCPNYGTSFESDDLADTVNTFPGHNIRYADSGHPISSEDGTIFRPFDTVTEAVNSVPSGGIVSIVNGSYNESITINKAMKIFAPVGTVTIGPSLPKIAENDGEPFPDYEYDLSDNQTPDKYNLSQNYPNPFNPQTTIQYCLPEASFVTLKVYNMLGQEIRTLINEHQPEGFKSVVWDGKNNQGEFLPSGTYIYLFEAGDYVKFYKGMLIK